MENNEGILDFLKNYFQINDCITGYKVIILVGLVLFIYSKCLNYKFKDQRSKFDPMNRNIGIYNNSAWVASHFILYFVLGFMFPYCARGFLTVGVIWEIFESIIGYYKSKVSDTECSPEKDNKYQYGKSWWTGTIKDIFVNAVGFLCGALISVYVLKKKCC